ncbi:hypothetical protein V2G26_009567, partial [Clonostachys chloroleuca]
MLHTRPDLVGDKNFARVYGVGRACRTTASSEYGKGSASTVAGAHHRSLGTYLKEYRSCQEFQSPPAMTTALWSGASSANFGWPPWPDVIERHGAKRLNASAKLFSPSQYVYSFYLLSNV